MNYRLPGLLIVLAIAGCADQFQHTPLSSAVPTATVRTRMGMVTIDPNFRLSDEERRRVRAGFDVDALEKLLAAIPPQHRAETLDFFCKRNPGEPVPLLTDIGDPALQELLDEVWAPRWLAMPEELEKAEERARRGSFELPGRAAALRRLQREARPERYE